MRAQLFFAVGLACVASTTADTAEVTFEILPADDASGATTSEVVSDFVSAISGRNGRESSFGWRA